jgi:sugar diacid utilization regulator
MSDDSKDSEIRDVMKEEKSRGKRRVDTKALELKQHRLKVLREALRNSKTEREFVETIRELGLADDPEKLREALKIWRASA